MDVDNFMVDILDCVEKSSFESLPVTKNNTAQFKSKKVPGWNEQVKPFRDEAYFRGSKSTRCLVAFNYVLKLTHRLVKTKECLTDKLDGVAPLNRGC